MDGVKVKEDVSSDPVDADSANSSITDPAQDLATGAAAFSPASSKNPRSSALTGNDLPEASWPT